MHLASIPKGHDQVTSGVTIKVSQQLLKTYMRNECNSSAMD